MGGRLEIRGRAVSIVRDRVDEEVEEEEVEEEEVEEEGLEEWRGRGLVLEEGFIIFMY